jgi:hypothetical protein
VVGPEEGSAAAFGAAEPDVSAALSQSGEGDSILSSQAGVEAAVPGAELTPESMLAGFEALRAAPAAAFADQATAWLQIAEEALDTFGEPGETHDRMMTAYRAVADEYGNWMALQHKHADLVARLGAAEAALAAEPAAGQAGAEALAWLASLEGGPAPVPPPVARLLAQAQAHASPPPAQAASQPEALGPDLSSPPRLGQDGPGSGGEAAGADSAFDLEALERDITAALGMAATMPTADPRPQAGPPKHDEPLDPALTPDELADLDRALSETLGAPVPKGPAQRQAPGDASPARDASAQRPAPDHLAPARGPSAAAPAGARRAGQAPSQGRGETTHQWWQRWATIGAIHYDTDRKREALEALRRDLKATYTAQPRQLVEKAAAACPGEPGMGLEIVAAWRHRIGQALIALGYLDAAYKELKAAGPNGLHTPRGICILDGMSDWGDLLGEEVFWLLADEWWDVFTQVARQTPTGLRPGSTLYSAHPQLMTERQAWVSALRRLGEELVRSFSVDRE